MNDIKVSNQEIAVDRISILHTYQIHQHQGTDNFDIQYKIHTQY